MGGSASLRNRRPYGSSSTYFSEIEEKRAAKKQPC
jgi:hypothetical protein